MKCFYCYKKSDKEYHGECSKKIFGTKIPPTIPYVLSDIGELAKKSIIDRITVPGVQPKLSMQFDRKTGLHKKKRLTIVGVLGDYILKPPTENYPSLPEIEDLTMHLAKICGIETVPHTLIKLKSGELAYITKRIDREKNNKLHMEDMCQLTETMSENKYRGSIEKIGRTLTKFSDAPGLDIINLFEITLFCFICGNADMHLKNFSLLRSEDNTISLSKAYDLVATKILIPSDPEEMALTLNGKKNRITRYDFDKVAEYLKINDTALKNTYEKFKKTIPVMIEFIESSFISKDLKYEYKKLINTRAKRILF
ncbi:toxin HipA [Candidatus Woesearchaeota archaeon CG11_big_fil_rev_8_21_14_0_20_43_8]|nr:MAG: toxin HipA [Candidatus Woesearchaeota archaeon CG11_big_fil_rev_8_21_14_0_20_43_8]